MTSEKKELWHQGEIPAGVVLRDVCKDVMENSELIVAVGDDGVIYRRFGKGVSWMKCNSGFGEQDNVYGVACDKKGTFVAGGRGGFIVKSADRGVTWSIKRLKVGDGDITKIAYGNGLFLAILDKGKLPGCLLASKDGDFWTEVKAGIPNGTSIEFLKSKFFVGCKNGDIFSGDGVSWKKCVWEKSDVVFTAARCVGYNPVNGIFYAAGHQCATSHDGVNWFAFLDLTKHPQYGNRNIHAIVPVGEQTFLFGEDCLILKHDGSIFTQVGQTGQGSVLGALLHDDRIITVGSQGEKYVLLEDLGADDDDSDGGGIIPPVPESIETRVGNVLDAMYRELQLIREIVKGK